MKTLIWNGKALSKCTVRNTSIIDTIWQLYQHDFCKSICNSCVKSTALMSVGLQCGLFRIWAYLFNARGKVFCFILAIPHPKFQMTFTTKLPIFWRLNWTNRIQWAGFARMYAKSTEICYVLSRFTQIAIEKSVAPLMNLRSGMSLSFTFIFLEMEFKSDTKRRFGSGIRPMENEYFLSSHHTRASS